MGEMRGSPAELETGPGIFVASEQYDELGPADRSVPAQYGSIVENCVRQGWVAEATRAVQATVGFADAYDPQVVSKLNLKAPLTGLPPHVARNIIPADVSSMYSSLQFPIVATTTMVGRRTRLKHGPETLDTEAFATKSELDRLWVEKIMKQRPLEVVPLGIGLVDGAGAVIDGRVFLLRVGWSDDIPLGTTQRAIASRIALNTDRIRQIMFLLR